MKWALENKDYYMAYILYNELNVGIPNHLLYSLPSKNFFSSIDNFMNTNYTKISRDKHLDNILKSFRKSKYTRLPEWNNSFGYRKL